MLLRYLRFKQFSSLQRSLLSSVAALFGYGFWAYMVNATHGVAAASKAAMVQGSYSFVLTFLMTLLVEAIYRLASMVWRSKLAINSVTIITTCGIIFSTSWWINVLAHTPEIFNTVILGFFIGGFFTTAYVVGLSSQKS